MTRLGEVKARRLFRALLRLGFAVAHQDGSHRFLKHPDGRTLLFAFHDSETVGPRALARVLKDWQISKEQIRASI